MKGNNTILMNGATMMEALQEYLDKRYNPVVKVVDVKYDPNLSVYAVRVEEVKTPNAHHN